MFLWSGWRYGSLVTSCTGSGWKVAGSAVAVWIVLILIIVFFVHELFLRRRDWRRWSPWHIYRLSATLGRLAWERRRSHPGGSRRWWWRAGSWRTPWRMNGHFIGYGAFVETGVTRMSSKSILVLSPRCNIRVIVTVVFGNFSFTIINRLMGCGSSNNSAVACRFAAHISSWRRGRWWARLGWQWYYRRRTWDWGWASPTDTSVYTGSIGRFAVEGGRAPRHLGLIWMRRTLVFRDGLRYDISGGIQGHLA